MTLIKLNDNIKKIVMVYQLEFVNKKSPGLGDFLRGCFFIRQLSKILNILLDQTTTHQFQYLRMSLIKQPAIKLQVLNVLISN